MSNRFPNSQFGLGVKDESRFKPKPRPRFLLTSKGHSAYQPLPDSRDPPAGSAPASSWSYSSGNDTPTPLLPESFGVPSYPIQDLPLCNQRSAIPNMDDILFERDQESPVLQSVRDNVEPERHENISGGEVIAVIMPKTSFERINFSSTPGFFIPRRISMDPPWWTILKEVEVFPQAEKEEVHDGYAKGKRGPPVHIERWNEVVSEPNFHQSNELKRTKNGEPTSGSPNPGTQERGAGKRIRLETSLLHRATQSPVKCLFEKHCSNSVQVEGIAECGLGDFVRITKRVGDTLGLDSDWNPIVNTRCLFLTWGFEQFLHLSGETLRAIVKKINAEKPSMLPFFAPDALAGILRDETYDHTSL
ncbi:hypothetical protein K438DRAFT_1779630 [Mycena galopus ATCC 62051]|nr:hypothetical protein K438DRAFT_1779630 [Mycena galopus ATCC 62051]